MELVKDAFLELKPRNAAADLGSDFPVNHCGVDHWLKSDQGTAGAEECAQTCVHLQVWVFGIARACECLWTLAF